VALDKLRTVRHIFKHFRCVLAKTCDGFIADLHGSHASGSYQTALHSDYKLRQNPRCLELRCQALPPCRRRAAVHGACIVKFPPANPAAECRHRNAQSGLFSILTGPAALLARQAHHLSGIFTKLQRSVHISSFIPKRKVILSSSQLL